MPKMAFSEKNEIVDRITSLGESAVQGTSIELVEIQLRGAGKARLLRVYIDKPGGVSHDDCQFVSERLGKLLDEDDRLLDGSYTLEVSSPGVERKLTKPRDFERITGQNIKLALRNPIEGQLRWEGQLQQFADGVLALETASGELLHIPLDQVQKANLKFEW
jgi:ribosome maturation factor RimP